MVDLPNEHESDQQSTAVDWEATDQYLTVCLVSYRADLVVCAATGEVDMVTAPLLRQALDKAAVWQARRIVVDLSQVRFLAMAGVRALAGAVAEIRSSGGRVDLVVPVGVVRRVLDLSGVTGEPVIYGSLSEALDDPPR
jgi:anti-sigma B factor antagonist